MQLGRTMLRSVAGIAVVALAAGCSEAPPPDRRAPGASPGPVETTGFLALGNDRLYYEVAGAGVPIVLIGGGSGMDLRQWDRVQALWTPDYRVIRYDPRGVGRSDNPTARYSEADDLAQLLDRLELARVAVIGLSSAGGLALEFAIQHPGRVAGVVVSAPFVPGFSFSDEMMIRLNRFNEAARAGREPFLDAMFEDPHFMPAPLDRAVRGKARQNMAEQFDKGADFDMSLPVAPDPPLIEQLARIQAPVLLLAGELDHPEVLRRNRVFAEQIPTTEQHTVADAGHNTHLENPRGFVAATAGFLGRLR